MAQETKRRPEARLGGQSRLQSFAEACVNVAVGYAVAIGTQIVVFPIFGIEASLTENAAIACIFTAVSLVRSYVLRRVFESFRKA